MRNVDVVGLELHDWRAGSNNRNQQKLPELHSDIRVSSFLIVLPKRRKGIGHGSRMHVEVYDLHSVIQYSKSCCTGSVCVVSRYVRFDKVLVQQPYLYRMLFHMSFITK